MANELKTEYENLVKEFTSFNLVRTAVITTVVLTLINAISLVRSPAIQENINRIRYLNTFTPEDSLQNDAVLEYLTHNSGQQDNDDGNITPKKDTVKAIAEKREALKKLKSDVGKALEIKLTFIADATLDLTYWIFILPLIFILTEVYNYLLSVKIKALLVLADRAPTTDGFDLERLQSLKTHYARFPHFFLKTIFYLVNYAMFGIYVFKLFSFFAITDADFIALFTWPYLIVSYYAVLYSIWVGDDILHQSGASFLEVSVLRNIYSKVHTLVKRVMHLRPKFSVPLSTSMLLGTLLLVMSTSGSCNNKEYSGLDLVRHPVSNNWQFNDDGAAFDKLLHMGYLYALLLVVLVALVYYLKIKVKTGIRNIAFGLLINLYMLFTIYFSVYFIHSDAVILPIFGAFALLFYYSYFRLRRTDKNEKLIYRLLLKALFPFAVFAYFFVSPNLGWLVFYSGLTLLVITSFNMIDRQPPKVEVT